MSEISSICTMYACWVQILGTKADYIGMIGSVCKRDVRHA